VLIRAIIIITLLLLTALFIVWKLAPGPEERLSGLGLPKGEVTASIRQGGELYRTWCARCHGADLKGTEQGPPLLHPYYRPEHHGDLAFYLAIANGVRQHHWDFGDMPAIPEVTSEQVPHVVAYVRARQREAGLIE
jgi:mono/diheme cytochrome c family protein